MSFDEQEQKYVKTYGFLTIKPIMFVANIAEADVANPDDNKYYQRVKEYALKTIARPFLLVLK